MTTVPMGVDIEADSAAIANRRTIPDGERTFLYFGTVARTRHLDFLVRVLAKVRESYPHVRLTSSAAALDPATKSY